MLWMAKFSTRRIRSSKEDNKRIDSKTFVYHGFVIFDTMDCDVGNWVDYKLLPQLTQHPPYFKIGVIGKDDHCGFATTSQLLLKMEASKKVIIVLSKDFGQSSQGKYVLTNMEYLSYQSGIDGAVVVTFENDRQAGGLLKRRQKQASISLLQYSNDQKFQSIFWRVYVMLWYNKLAGKQQMDNSGFMILEALSKNQIWSFNRSKNVANNKIVHSVGPFIWINFKTNKTFIWIKFKTNEPLNLSQIESKKRGSYCQSLQI